MRPFSVALPRALRLALEEVARADERKPSAVARIAIKEYVERRKGRAA